MNFLQPWMLLGLAAALIPLVIHMMNRRKAQRVAFPMMEWVRRSQKRVARRLHLKRWLLLAARMGILLLIPLAMAQPYALCGGTTEQRSDRAPAAVVVIVDGSASMRLAQGGESTHERALSAARSALRGLRSWDQARVLVAQEEPVWITERWTNDSAASFQALENYTFQDGTSNLPRALMEARNELLVSTQPSRRVVLITDSDVGAWQDPNLRPALLAGMGDLEVVVLRPNEERARGLIVDALEWEESASSSSDLIEIRALVRAPGLGVNDARVQLFVDDEPVALQKVSVAEEGSASVVFAHNFRGEGVHWVRVRVEGATGIAPLQERTMPVYLGRSVRALLVNGSSSAVQRNDELFYLERALRVDIGERQAIRYQVVTAERFSSAALDDFDVVLLANVTALPAEEVGRLTAFVEGGGGLWITPGAMVDATQYNANMSALLPRPIRAVTRLSSPEDPDANIRATRFAHIDHSGALFRIFSMAGGESLHSARVFSYLLLDPEVGSSAKVLASYGDGGPAVLEHTVGAGRVILWTTTVDMDWTDLPIRTAYLPLVHRTLRYLAQRGASSSTMTDVGSPLRMDFSGLGLERVEITGPAGKRYSLPVESDAALFRPQERGAYSVQFVKGNTAVSAPEFAFAVNAPRSEADGVAADEATVQAWAHAAREGAVTGELADTEENRRRVWPALLLVALLLLYAESLLSVRRRVWEGLRFRRSV